MIGFAPAVGYQVDSSSVEVLLPNELHLQLSELMAAVHETRNESHKDSADDEPHCSKNSDSGNCSQAQLNKQKDHIPKRNIDTDDLRSAGSSFDFRSHD
jgi:hypothetical protein